MGLVLVGLVLMGLALVGLALVGLVLGLLSTSDVRGLSEAGAGLPGVTPVVVSTAYDRRTPLPNIRSTRVSTSVARMCYTSDKRSLRQAFDSQSSQPILGELPAAPTEEITMSALASWPVTAPSTAPRPTRHLRLVRSPEPAPTGPGASRERAGGLRLTRRGRQLRALAIVTLGLVVVLGLVLAGPAMGVADPAPSSSTTARTVVVRAGQTLSEVALGELPELPLDDAIARIQLANAMNSPHVLAGQRLVIPAP